MAKAFESDAFQEEAPAAFQEGAPAPPPTPGPAGAGVVGTARGAPPLSRRFWTPAQPDWRPEPEPEEVLDGAVAVAMPPGNPDGAPFGSAPAPARPRRRRKAARGAPFAEALLLADGDVALALLLGEG